MIKKLVVHVSDTPDDKDFGAADIRRWHTDKPPHGNGWNDIGYHYVVRRNCKIEKGREEHVTGAHTAGHNTGSLGVCWIGRNSPAPGQLDTLIELLVELCTKHGLRAKDVYGHRELNPGKTCPNIDPDYLRQLLVVALEEAHLAIPR